MKFNLSGKKLQILIVLLVIAGVIGIAYYVKISNANKPITTYNFQGSPVEFRADLRQAQNVSVYPDEQSIFNEIWNPDVYRVKIAYVPTENSSTDNGILAAEAFEVRSKLDLAYSKQDWGNVFSGVELKSFENLSYANDTLVVALVRPSLSDKTAVELHGNIIYIKGTTAKDFDMATVKFLMLAMNITV